MSIFHKSDLIVTVPVNSSVVNIIKLGHFDHSLTLPLIKPENYKTVDVRDLFPIRNGFVVICSQSIQLVRNVDIKPPKKETKCNQIIRISQSSIMKEESNFLMFEKGCHVIDDLIFLAYRKKPHGRKEFGFLVLDISQPNQLQPIHLSVTLKGRIERIELIHSSPRKPYICILSNKLLFILDYRATTNHLFYQKDIIIKKRVQESRPRLATQRGRRYSIRSPHTTTITIRKFQDICFFHLNYVLVGNLGYLQFDFETKKFVTCGVFQKGANFGKCRLLYEGKDYIIILSNKTRIIKIEMKIDEKTNNIRSFSSILLEQLPSKTMRFQGVLNRQELVFTKKENNGISFYPFLKTFGSPATDLLDFDFSPSKPPITKLIFVKSKSSLLDDTRRLESVLEITEGCDENEEEKSNPSFWPENPKILFYELRCNNDRVLRIPKFMVDCATSFSSIFSDEIILEDEKLENISEREFLEFFVYGKVVPMRNALFDLFRILVSLGLEYHQIYLWKTWIEGISNKDMILMFSNCVRFHENKKEDEEEEEDLMLMLDNLENDDGLKKEKRSTGKVKFEYPLSLLLFLELGRRDRSGEITNKNDQFGKILQKLGYLHPLVMFKKDGRNAVETKKHQSLVSKMDQLKSFHFSFFSLYEIWMRRLRYKFDESEVSDVILRIDETKVGTRNLFVPKLSLVLFSNFFEKIFRFGMSLAENSNREVSIMGLSKFKLLQDLMKSHIFPVFLGTFQSSICSLEEYLELQVHFHMYDEHVFYSEIEFGILRKMKEISKEEEIARRVLEIGWRFDVLPDDIVKRMFECSLWSKKVDELVVMKMFEYSVRWNEMVQKSKLEVLEERRKVQDLEGELNEFRKREREEKEKKESEKKKRKLE